jgi:invasion protein IalB
MPFSLKRLGAAKRLSAAGLAGLMLLNCAGAFAQPRKQPASPAPAAAPAAPPPSDPSQGASQQAQGQPQGPVKLDLIPTQNEWTKVCGKDPNAGKEICYTTRDFSAQAEQPPVLAVAVYDIKGEDTRIVRLLLPVGLMLRPGLRFAIDKGPTNEGTFEICFPNGCFAESKVKGTVVAELKKGTSLLVAVKNQINNEVTFAVPLAGFGKAFDGPPVDPKVLEEQQKKLQAELQKRAEDERKKLEAAQPQGTAPSAGAQTGAAAIAPAASAPAPAAK